MTVHLTNIPDATASKLEDVQIFAAPRANGAYRNGLKRALDTFLILLAMPFVLPFCLLVAIVISFDGHSPIFRQERVGKNGRRFSMWKFRTMVPGAESMLDSYLDGNFDARSEWNSTQKLKDDPRCTRFGRIMRRTSLDELPQLLNVLIGDMALVGPRPMLPSQQSLYPGTAYYRLRPGITGFWQVSVRNSTEFVARANYDDLYDKEMSLKTDVALLARTVHAVVRGTGY